MIRVDQRGGGLGSGMPLLNAGWVPHQLVFAARGAPPFTLAYGNRAAQAGSQSAQKELGGEARLQAQIDWKRWSLWGVLGLGVLVLGAMAWRLMKQLGSTTPGKDDAPRQ